MQKEILEQFINDGLSASKISKKVGKTPATVITHLKKYGLSTKFISFNNPLYKRTKEINNEIHRICPLCNQFKTLDNFYTRNANNVMSHCKICSVALSVHKQKLIKQQCLDYKGGKCVYCGYDKCIAALDFHHLDPTQKEFGFSGGISSFNDKIKQELDKCIILCSNCHREEHSRIYQTSRPVIIVKSEDGSWKSIPNENI